MSDFHVELDAFTGPIDLLLYLVKKDEVDVTDVPISRITNQYLNYIEWINRLDPETAGAFLVMAAALIELKSRVLLPVPPEEAEDDEELLDPRLEIVRQLIEYKEMKEAAFELALRADERSSRIGRPGETWDEEEPDEEEGKLEDVSLWRLFDAFNDILRQTGQTTGMHIVADDTPIEIVAQRLVANLNLKGVGPGQTIPLRELVDGQISRGLLISLLLAMLELIRQGQVRVVQREKFGEILVMATDLIGRAWLAPKGQPLGAAVDAALAGAQAAAAAEAQSSAEAPPSAAPVATDAVAADSEPVAVDPEPATAEGSASVAATGPADTEIPVPAAIPDPVPPAPDLQKASAAPEAASDAASSNGEAKDEDSVSTEPPAPPPSASP